MRFEKLMTKTIALFLIHAFLTTNIAWVEGSEINQDSHNVKFQNLSPVVITHAEQFQQSYSQFYTKQRKKIEALNDKGQYSSLSSWELEVIEKSK